MPEGLSEKRVGKLEVSDQARRQSEFRKLLEETAAVVRLQNIECEPYRSANLEKFARLTERKQINALEALRHFHSILNTAFRFPELGTHAATVPSMTERLGWHGVDAVMDFVTDEMMVEIYDIDSHQVFRNIRFFPLSKCSLEEMCTVPWFELWERDAHATRYMLEIKRMLIDHEITGVMSYLLPTHDVRDYNARVNASKKMCPLYLAPLYTATDRGSLAGFISVFRSD